MGNVNTTKQCHICQTGTLTEHEELALLVRRGVMLCVTEQWYSVLSVLIVFKQQSR